MKYIRTKDGVYEKGKEKIVLDLDDNWDKLGKPIYNLHKVGD